MQGCGASCGTDTPASRPASVILRVHRPASAQRQHARTMHMHGAAGGSDHHPESGSRAVLQREAKHAFLRLARPRLHAAPSVVSRPAGTAAPRRAAPSGRRSCQAPAAGLWTPHSWCCAPWWTARPPWGWRGVRAISDVGGTKGDSGACIIWWAAARAPGTASVSAGRRSMPARAPLAADPHRRAPRARLEQGARVAARRATLLPAALLPAAPPRRKVHHRQRCEQLAGRLLR